MVCSDAGGHAGAIGRERNWLARPGKMFSSGLGKQLRRSRSPGSCRAREKILNGWSERSEKPVARTTAAARLTSRYTPQDPAAGARHGCARPRGHRDVQPARVVSGAGCPGTCACPVCVQRRVIRVVAGGDFFGCHGQDGQGWRGSGVDGVAQQQRHRVAGSVGEGAVEGEVGEGAVAVLPGGEGEQAGGCGDVSGLGVAGQVGPQPLVGVGVGGVHAGPRVVADPQVGKRDREPGEPATQLDGAAVPVGGDGGLDGFETVLDDRPVRNRRWPRCGR